MLVRGHALKLAVDWVAAFPLSDMPRPLVCPWYPARFATAAALTKHEAVLALT